MEKIKKWIRKWSFMIVLLGMGLVYFSCTDSWMVYAKPVKQAQEWLGRQEKEQDNKENNSENVSGGNATGDSSSIEDTEAEITTETTIEAMEETFQSETSQLETNQSETLQAESSLAENIHTVSSSDAGEKWEQIVYGRVEEDYFADALFIGDSRTVGLYEYGGLEEIATFYASTGLTIQKMFTAPIVKVPGQKEKQTIEEALAEKQFAKIYLMIGINEMGSGTVDSFIEEYESVIAHLQELQPDAIIYVQGIIKVTNKRSQQGDYIHNEGIEARNAELAKLADNINVFYLDVNPLICDEEGGVIANYTYDGVHLKAQYISIWKEFLKENAVKKVVLD